MLVVAGLVLAVTTLPLLLLVAAALSLVVPGRWRPLRLLAFFLLYLTLEVAGLAAALALWIASGFGWRLRSPAFVDAHYRLLRLLLAGVDRAARVIFRVDVETDDEGWSPLDDGVPGSIRPMVVLSRHAGPGDSFLLVRTLMNRDHLRRPRIVLSDTLQLDPLVDVLLHRLPVAWVPARPAPGQDVAAAIGRLAAGMGDGDALLIFPEGGNFTAARRTRAIAKLRSLGRGTQAAQAEAMPYVLPPRPGGVQAALAGAPRADVVFVAHTGLEHLASAGAVWRELPMDQVLHLRWDVVPAGDVPREPEAQVSWLYEHWAEIDAWVGARTDR